MKSDNTSVIVFSQCRPSVTDGGGLAGYSSLKLYCSEFNKVYYFSVDHIQNKNLCYENNNLEKFFINIHLSKPWERFLRSIFFRNPAVTMQYMSGKLIKTLTGEIDKIICGTDDKLIFIFEDLPIASLMPVLLRKYPNIKMGVRSTNVLSNIFVKLTKEGLIKYFWRYEVKKIKRYEYQIYKNSSFFWAISDNDKLEYDKLGIKCNGIMSTGIDIEKYSDIKDGDIKNVITIGGVDIRKKIGIENFINKSWNRIKSAIPEAQLIIAGKNSEIFDNVAPGVRGLGFVSDDNDILNMGKIFINTQTIGSGIKLKSIVAVLAGKTLVTTPIGIEGIIGEPGKHYLVADDWESFAESIVRLVKNPDVADTISTEGRNLFKTYYSEDSFIERSIPLIDSIK